MFLWRLLFGAKMSTVPDTRSLRYFAARGNIPSFKDVLERSNETVNVVVDDLGKTALHYAVYCGRIKMVKWLISKGAEVNAKDVYELTPLHMVFPRINYYYINVKPRLSATEPEHREYTRKAIAFTLLENGANINSPDGRGSTPLKFAVLQHSFSVIKLLMENGANLTQSDNGGVTPLHVADSVGCLDFVLKCYGDIDKQDGSGNTLLHSIMRPEGDIYSTEVVRNVLKRGANVNITNNCNKTPYYYSIVQVFNYLRLCTRFCHIPMCYQLHLQNKKTLVKHIVKLKEAGVSVVDDVSSEFDGKAECESGELRKLQQDCREELKKMALTPIHANVTLRQVFKNTVTLKTSRGPYYLVDQNMVNSFEEMINHSDFNIRFPLYAETVKLFYLKSKKRYSLIRNAILSLFDKNGPQTFQSLSTDQYAVDYLFEYLSDTDLENLIQSVNMNILTSDL